MMHTLSTMLLIDEFLMFYSFLLFDRFKVPLFDRRFECGAPKRWSNYTTYWLKIAKISFNTRLWWQGVLRQQNSKFKYGVSRLDPGLNPTRDYDKNDLFKLDLRYGPLLYRMTSKTIFRRLLWPWVCLMMKQS